MTFIPPKFPGQLNSIFDNHNKTVLVEYAHKTDVKILQEQIKILVQEMQGLHERINKLEAL